jgi:hypothetical protein
VVEVVENIKINMLNLEVQEEEHQVNLVLLVLQLNHQQEIQGEVQDTEMKVEARFPVGGLMVVVLAEEQVVKDMLLNWMGQIILTTITIPHPVV